MNKLADVGKAENQPVSAKILKTAEAMSGVITEAYTMQELNEEIARLQHTINEQAKQIDSLEARLHNQAVTIRLMAGTIAELPTAATHATAATENPSICPKEPLIAPETGEPVAVHTAPNIRWAGGK